MARIPIQTVYKYYIDFGIGMRIYFSDLEPFDVVEIDCGALCLDVIVSLVCPCTVPNTNRVCMHLPCLCEALLVLSTSYAASDQDRVTARTLYIRLQQLALSPCHD